MTRATWFGQVPAGWTALPLFAVARERKHANKDLREQNLLSLSFGRIIRKDITASDGLLPASFETYQIIEADDIVLRMTDLQNDQRSLRSGLVLERGIITSAYLALALPGVDARFMAYQMRAIDQMKVFYSMGGGLRQSIGYDDLKRLPVLVPPMPQQRAIADFLDRETATIDAFIAKNEELITLLTERRMSQISFAVSQGVHSDADMHVTPELTHGRAPAHWQVLPLKRAVGYQEGPGILAEDFVDAGVPLLRISSVRGASATLDGCNYLDPRKVRSRWAHFAVKKGDLLISASASMGTVSEVGDDSVVGAIPYTGIIRIAPGAMQREFAKWFFISREFATQAELLKTGSTIQHFGPSHLGQMFVALPPRDEQAEIASHLRSRIAAMDALIERAHRAVDLARERRAALISAAVTGKIDVGVSA